MMFRMERSPSADPPCFEKIVARKIEIKYDGLSVVIVIDSERAEEG
jgi:hypothetical protein